MRFIVKSQSGEKFAVQAEQVAIEGAMVVFYNAKLDGSDDKIVAAFREPEYIMLATGDVMRKGRWNWL